MSGMIFMVSIPTECEENKSKIKSIDVPSIVITNEHQMSWTDRKGAATESGSFETNHIQPLPQNAASYDKAATNDATSSPLLRMSTANKGYQHLNDDESASIKSTVNPTTNEPNSIRKSWEGFKDIVTSAKRLNPLEYKRADDDASSSNNGFLDIASDSSMETILNELLKKLGIDNSVWQTSRDGAFYQITFTVEADHRHTIILSTLDEWGIGHRKGSSVSVIPCTVYNSPSRNHEEKNPKDFCEEWILSQKQTTWERFLSSIRARLNVAQIVEEVKEDASLTFDFVTLIIVASTLAAFGLVENSMILLVSSMLISPLMRPIIATIFGIVIEDNVLIRFGWANEMFGVFLATAVGFVFGLVVHSLDLYSHADGNALVTEEMISRCEIHSLIVGILTALPSGAAVAIAILGENIGSLVGVAISASILPPAVNTGIFWSMAVLHSLNAVENQTMIKSNYFSDHQSIELAIHGALSMLLTAANIACILLMGVVVLKIKEVAPIATKHHRQFWEHDIKLARDYNQTHPENEDEFTQKLAEEINEMEQAGVTIDTDFSAGLFRDINRKSYQNTWSPSLGHTNATERRTSLADLEKICAHLSATPTRYDRRRRASTYANAINKSSIAKSVSPPQFRTSKNAHSRRESSAAHHMNVSNLERISEVNQTASTSTVFETLPYASSCQSDDNASAKSSSTMTTTNSKPKKPTRRFIVTPVKMP